MCRLLGYVSTRPIAVVDVLGEEGFDAFTSLAVLHGDGWGMAWHDETGTHAEVSPRSAIDDERYRRLADRPLGSAGLVHLRWATGGFPVAPENTHPFVDGGYAFAHNGNITPVGELEKLLTGQSRARLSGATDSERYFRLVLQCIEEEGDEAGGVTKALGLLMRQFPNASLNALLLTPARLFAVHINGRAHSPRRALQKLFGSEDRMPIRHATEYYAMDYRVTEDAVHIVSSGLGQEGWTAVPPDAAAMIDLATREVVRLEPHRVTQPRL